MKRVFLKKAVADQPPAAGSIKNAHEHKTTLLLLLVFALLAGCRQAGQPPGPTAAPNPALRDRLIFQSDDHRWWQVKLQDGSPTTQDVGSENFTLPPQGQAAIFSPDGRYKVTAYGDKWNLNDTADGTDRPLVDEADGNPLVRPAFDRECEAFWSPDGRQAAFLADQGLYLAGPDGKARLVLARRLQWYTEDGSPGLALNSRATLETQISCPAWLSSEAVLVSHFKGAFPASFTGTQTQTFTSGRYRHEVLDTSSVLQVLPAGSEMRDLPQVCRVIANVLNGSFVVLKQGTGQYEGSGDYTLVSVQYLLSGQGQAPVALAGCSSPGACERFVFSQDGRQLAFIVTQPEIKIEVWGRGTQPVISLPLAKDLEPQSQLFWSPGGDALAYTRGWGKPDGFILVISEGRILPLKISYTLELPFYLYGWIK